MGWFDEDDSDEEEEVKRPPSLMTMMSDPLDITAATATAATAATATATANYKEDPLDLYMKSLQPDTPSKPRAERLDVDNADEATSHWKERDAAAEQKEEEERVASSQASTAAQEALDLTFHKAAASTNTNVSIQLTPVRHNEINYCPFQRVMLRQQLQIDSDVAKNTSAGDTAKAWRKQHNVSCTPTTVDPITSFADIQQFLLVPSSSSYSHLNAITNQITNSGYATPTPVQAQTLAVALAGHDALVTASTGSGKTMAYVWPMLYHIQYNSTTSSTITQGGGPKGLILVPTREIAQQVHKHVKAAMTATSLQNKSIAITGGVNRYQLVQDLKRHPVQVVVATPGRLLDVLSIKKNGLSLQHVTFLVLDECDKMLDMGFEDQVQQLLTNVRPDRQSLLLSATLGRKIECVANQWLSRHNSIRIAVGHTGRASDHVQQHVMVLPNFHAKQAWLQEMLPVLSTLGLTLVFVATRVNCETLATKLQENDPSLQLATLHGDKHATDRKSALRAFGKADNPIKTLICTDVASRGLDMHVATVVSFDPAKNLDIHVHRIGRAGRLAKKEGGYREGTAYTLLLGKKNADFAHVLMQSFEREGREISPELRQSAQQSRRKSGATESREKWSKAGLGFDDGDTSRYGPASSRAEDLAKASPSAKGGGFYYGPSEKSSREEDYTLNPPVKKSRWG